MQPQQFAVKATWTQLLPPSRPGTFLPWLRAPSSVFVNHLFPSLSTAAVVSLSLPLGGQYTNNKRNNTSTAPRKKTKYKLKWKEARPSTGSLPNNTNQTSFTRENKLCVIYFEVAFSRILLPVDIQHILITCLFFIREKICGRNTTSQRDYIVML